MHDILGVLKQIQKHNNKLNRILCKLSEENPSLNEKIDLALYSSLKIEKIIKKNITQSTKNTDQQDKDNQFIYNTQNEGLYQNAFSIIQAFKISTYKLDKKVNILINQSSQHKKQYYPFVYKKNTANQRQQFYKTINEEYSNKKLKKKNSTKILKQQNRTDQKQNITDQKQHRTYQKQHRTDQKQHRTDQKQKRLKYPQRTQRVAHQITEQQQSKQYSQQQSQNISQIDKQIIQLTNQIKYIMKKDQRNK